MPSHPYYPYARGIYDRMVAEIKHKTEDFNIIGTYVERFDGYPKASGQAKFPSDVQLPGMLYGKFLKCPYAHAKIVSLDTSKAEALPGVKAVLTYKDEDVFGPFPMAVKDIKIIDGLALLPEEANWQGETIGAAVCAESEEICDEALKLLEVEWEELPFVLTIEDCDPANIWHQTEFSRCLIVSDYPDYQEDESYDIEKGFQDADVQVEGRVKWDYIPHAASEPNAAVAQWDSDMLTLWIHTQRPQVRPSTIAKCLGIPSSHVNLNMLYQGGMFGQNHIYNSESMRLDLTTIVL
ncbi:unnamed protein product, partial [marine sediment metagenome]